jgi:hypothetical protein
MLPLLIAGAVGIGIYKLFTKDQTNETLSETGPDISSNPSSSEPGSSDSGNYRRRVNDAKHENNNDSSRDHSSCAVGGESKSNGPVINQGVNNEQPPNDDSGLGGGTDGGIETDAVNAPTPGSGG